jgi:anti-sigma factor RsiW
MTDDAPRPSGPPDFAPDWDTLGRFVAGESSADEMSQVGKWLDANPADNSRVRTFRVTDDLYTLDGIGDHPAGLEDLTQTDAPRRPAARLAASGVRESSRRGRRRGLPCTPPGGVAGRVGNDRGVANFSTNVGKRDSPHASMDRAWSLPDSRLTVPADFGSELVP